VRAHVIALNRTMPYTRIGELSGIASKDVRRLVSGRDDGDRKGQIPKQTERSKAEALLAVPVPA
jgi:hypothetical protein